jgi:hypothetical protein
MEGNEMSEAGDMTKAEALRIAYDRLKCLGWRYEHSAIGEVAADILKALDKRYPPQPKQDNPDRNERGEG